MEYLIVCTAEISMSTRLTKRIKQEVNSEGNILEEIIRETCGSRPVIEVTGNRLRIRTTTSTAEPERTVESALNNLWGCTLGIWKLDMGSRKIVSRVKDISVQVTKISD